MKEMNVKLPTIHKVNESGSLETRCGVRLPNNTTTQDEMVTCWKCKRSIRENNKTSKR